MWSALQPDVQEYIYDNDLPLHVAHIDAAKYDLPDREVRVAGLARNADQTLFVNSTKPGRDWELPGGRIDPDESPETAIRREFTEETGYEVEDVEPALVMLWVFPDSTITQLVFNVEHGEKTSTPVDEVSDVDWFTELPSTISFGEDGHATYEFIVNNESVEVQVTDGRLDSLLSEPPWTKTRSIAVVGVAGGAAITAGLARRLLTDHDNDD